MTVQGIYPDEDFIRTYLGRKEGEPTGAFRAVLREEGVNRGEYGVRGWAVPAAQKDSDAVGAPGNQSVVKAVPAVAFYSLRDSQLHYHWGGPYPMSDVFIEGDGGSLSPASLPE